jgi:hypothetical protein
MRSLVEPPKTQKKNWRASCAVLGLDRQVLSHKSLPLGVGGILWSLRAPVGCVVVHTKRVYRATPPPAAYTERPIRVAWNTSKGWRGVPYPPAPPRRRSLGPPSGGPPHTGLTAHVWWTPYAAVGVTIRIVLSLVGVCLYSPHPRVPVPPTGKSLRSFAAPSASSRISAEILANAPIFPWGPRLSPTVA